MFVAASTIPITVLFSILLELDPTTCFSLAINQIGTNKWKIPAGV